eukprot:TRINITY_DN2324_c0_g3_i2.p1 TRINITY_DN2324_c0_g3~~TRINITY_DN2324_c0_g3_i2.p1  ORF type:complete len:324 (-),score=56.18 TRINITY_DN2324_c0_g3_i2:117-1088(-)
MKGLGMRVVVLMILGFVSCSYQSASYTCNPNVTSTTPYPATGSIHFGFTPNSPTTYFCNYTCDFCDDIPINFGGSAATTLILTCQNAPGIYCGEISIQGSQAHLANVSLHCSNNTGRCVNFSTSLPPTPCIVDDFLCGTNQTWASQTSSPSQAPSNFLPSSLVSPSPVPSPTTFPLECSSLDYGNLIRNLTACVVATNVSVSTPVFTLYNYSSLIVSGSISFSNSTTSILTSGQIISAPSITFGGNLILNLTDTDKDKLNSGGTVVIPIANYNASNGAYSTIVVENAKGASGSQCEKGEYGEHSMSVIVSPNCGGEENEGGQN